MAARRSWMRARGPILPTKDNDGAIIQILKVRVTSSKRRAAIEAARVSSEGTNALDPPQPSQREGVSQMCKRKLEHGKRRNVAESF